VKSIHTWLFTLTFALLSSAPPAMPQELSGEQQQKLDAVVSGLNQAKTNLKLAQDSAGPGTDVPQGSRAKLSKMRLDTAAANMPQMQQWLAELPADAAAVKPVAAEFATTQQAIAALDARLAGSDSAVTPPAVAASAAAGSASAPTSAPASAAASAPASAPAAAAGVKLGYQQEEILKGANYNLRDVEGFAAALTQLVAELKPQADQMAIDYRQAQTGMNTIETARRKAGFTQDALNKLPPDGAGIAETAQGLATALTEIATAESYLKPLSVALNTSINPANYPELQADLKRLGELASMYGNPMILQSDRPQAAAVLKEVPAAQAEAERIAKIYQPLKQQQTEDGKRFEGAGNYFQSNLQTFQAAAEQQKQALPQEIRADLAEASRTADTAAADQNPLLYTGGVPQAMGNAGDKLALYAVLDPANAPALEKELQGTQASLQQREKSLGQLIIQQNPLPPDRYTGADREKVVAVAVDAWKGQQAEFKLLASRIPSEAWSRETLWQYSNRAWTFVDRSTLQVQLILADADDASLAVIRPVNIWMDHQKGATLIGVPLHSGDEALQPSNYLVRDKIR
jgi:hypothetical protein